MSEQLPSAEVAAYSPAEPASTPAKVLIRAPNWVGDAVMAVPALRELRRIFAHSLVTIAARPWVAGLFDGECLADNLISLRETPGVFKRATELINNARIFRRERFDYSVLLPNSFASALTMKAAGVSNIAGYPTDRRRFLLNHVISFEPDYKKLHQVRYYLNFAAQIERNITGTTRVDYEGKPRLEVGKDQREHARFLLEQFGLADSRNRPIVVINPGATNSSAKRWLAERFAETADLLSEREGFQTVIVGTEGDSDLARRVAGLMRTKALMLAGRTSIAELKAVLACSRLVISNDTGTAHVAAALEVPTVVVFGPTEHVATRPLSEKAKVVRHDVECSPCMLRECPIDHRCMTGVQVDDVERAARQLLAHVALPGTDPPTR